MCQFFYMFLDHVWIAPHGHITVNALLLHVCYCVISGNERRDNSSVDSLDPYSEYSPVVKTHLSPTNLSRDSGLFSSDTGLNEDYSSELDSVNQRHPRHVPVLRTHSHDTGISHNAALLQPGTHSTSSSVPTDGAFEPSLDTMEQLGSDIVQSYPSKAQSRKMVKRKMEPVYTSDTCRMPTVHSGVELRTNNQVENAGQNKEVRTKPVAPRGMPKRSNDSALGSSLGSSLGSVEESSETYDDEFQERYSKETGLLRKSESGAKLYFDENLLHSGAMPANPPIKTVVSTQASSQQGSDIPMAFHNSIKRKNTEKSNITCSNSPPLTRHSWGGILDNQKEQDGERTSKAHTVHEQPGRNHCKSSELGSSVSSVKNKNRFSLSPADSLEEETEDEFLRVNNETVINTTASVAPNTTKTLPDSSTVTTVSSSVQLVPPVPRESNSQPKQHVTRNPKLRDIKSQSLDCSRSVYVQYPTTQIRHSMYSVMDAEQQPSSKLSPRDSHSEILKGMTPRGSDLFPNKVNASSLKVVVPACEESSGLPNTHANKASVHRSANPRSKSAPRVEVDYEGHIPQSAKLVKQLRNEKSAMERSSSDTRLSHQFMLTSQEGGSVSNRPERPPSYEEAMKRKGLYDQKLQQKQASARARKLYEESQKKYTEEQKQKEYAYFSEPEAVVESREAREVSERKILPSYEVACKRSEHFKEQRRKEVHSSPPNYYESRKEKCPRDSREGTPVKKNDFSSRDSTPVQSIEDREKTPTPQDVNMTSVGGEKKKRNKSRERREGQRLSDTRLENSRKKKKGAGVHRSKSDSSEHKLTQLRSKVLDNGDSTDSDEDRSVSYRPRRVTKSVDRTASKERLNGAMDIPLHKSSRTTKERPKSLDTAALLRKLQESGMDVIDSNEGGTSINARHNIRKNTTVKNKDWHKELAEQYEFKASKPVYQSENMQRPQMHFRYNRSVSVDDEDLGSDDTSLERHKKRWVPPVHPSKDLVVLNNTKAHQGSYGKDYSLNRSSSNVTASKKQKSYIPRELRSNTIGGINSGSTAKDVKTEDSKTMAHGGSNIEHNQNGDNHGTGTYSQHSKIINRNTQAVHDAYRNSDSAASTNSEREDSDIEDRKGLSWSVSKLRNLYDVNASQPSHQPVSKPSSAASVKNKPSSQGKTVTSGHVTAAKDTGGQASTGRGEVIILSRPRGPRFSHEAVNPNAEKQYV